MDWGDLITKTFAALGAGLGVFNSWQGWKQRKVRLQVIPTAVEVQNQVDLSSSGAPIMRAFISPGISVVNLSSSPVTLEEVGYDLGGEQDYQLTRIDAAGRWSSCGIRIPEKLPQRLETRASLRMVWGDQDEQRMRNKHLRRAYARTACGTVAYGSNPTLETLAERLVQGQNGMEPVGKAT